MSALEIDIQNSIRKALSEEGVVNWRNHTFALKDKETGRLVRGGLCVGSSDVIAITPVVITSEMVGSTVGVFTAVEVKTGTGKATQAQSNFIAMIRKHGGLAGVARSVEEALNIIREHG